MAPLAARIGSDPFAFEACAAAEDMDMLVAVLGIDVMPPFGITVPTVIGWRAALQDHAYRAADRAQVQESKALVYEFCERTGIEYWPSAGNFVLIRIGGDIPEALAVLRAHGVLIKDRSREHGCEGCVRITAGVAAHTRLALAALQRLLDDRGVDAAVRMRRHASAL